MTVTIGVSGVGSIGVQHVLAFAEAGARVVAWDPGSEPDEVRERTLGRARVVAGLDELIATADGVVVAAPDEFHAEQLSAIVEAGLPVLVEKPITSTVAAAVELQTRVADSTVLVGYVLRHYRSMQRARELIESGAIGELVSFHATVGAYDTIRLARARFSEPQPDRLYLDYSHEWDYVSWLVGRIDRCIAVAGVRGRLDVRESPNVVDALLVGEGISGTVHLDYVQDPSRRSLTVIGDRGSLSVLPTQGELRCVVGGEEQVEHFGSEREQGLRRQAEHFIGVVEGFEPPKVRFEDGLAALRMADAVRRAARSGDWEVVDEGTTT
ncbi:UNVERIFIED_CONTAM: Gfo/Idh/MocA family oxidoreductase [Microbacterium sp. SLM126]